MDVRTQNANSPIRSLSVRWESEGRGEGRPPPRRRLVQRERRHVSRAGSHPVAANGSRPGVEATPAFRLPARTLLTSTCFPPFAAGHAVILDRMFRGIHPDDYCIAYFDESLRGLRLENGWSELPARTFHTSSRWWEWNPAYRLAYVRRFREFTGETVSGARMLARICREEACEAIIATTGSLPRLPAAVLAGRLARVPVILLIWDFWRHLEFEPFHHRTARALEPTVLRQAAAIVVPNEMLAESIARTSGVRPVIIRLPADDAAFHVPDGLADEASPLPAESFNLTFTGQVYFSMTEPYQRLLAALECPGLEDVAFHFFGPQAKDRLEAWGLHGRYVTHTFLPPWEIAAAQRGADALFLPLAFDGLHKNLVYSSSTSKLSDYLASGRPILVHTPPGAFPAWYVRRHECGLVVDTPDPAALARAIALLRDDEPLRQRLGRNAMIRARTDFSIATARQQLADLLANVTGRSQ
jgi:glycosyltransferase involved in cell wall biosynthesis